MLRRHAGREVLVEHSIDGGADRHLDAQRRRQDVRTRARSDTFGDVPQRAEYRRQRLAGGQHQPDAAVARQIAGRGQHQIAEAGQPHEGLALAAERYARRAVSARPRVMSAARALWPKPRPSLTPVAIASTFFTAPPISTPIKSSLT